jgi:hypothetical protein
MRLGLESTATKRSPIRYCIIVPFPENTLDLVVASPSKMTTAVSQVAMFNCYFLEVSALLLNFI